MIFLVSGLFALLVDVSLVRPFAWPDSSLETIFRLVGAGNCFLGCVLCGLLAKCYQSQRCANSTHAYHSRIMCGYLLMTSACYYEASQHPDRIGLALMIVALASYAAWYFFLFCLGCKDALIVRPDRA